MATKLSKDIKEPSILVKPVSRFGGLDTIHVGLIILVAILVLTILVMSYNTKITITNATNVTQQCKYGAANGTCITPVHNQSQVMMYAKRVLAGYINFNSSLSLLPYLSNVSAMNVSYLAGSREWYASVPYKSPTSNSSYIITMAIRDSNLSLAGVLFQGVGPAVISASYVAAPGVVHLAGQTGCLTGNSVKADWIVDPYAPGGISSLVAATKLRNEFGSSLNLSVDALFTQYSTTIAGTYGLNNTMNLERYMICGSVQSNFTGFVSALNASYPGTYMPESVLQGIVQRSGFNMTSLGSCMASSQQLIDAQYALAKHYNVTSSPVVVTDCQYESLPQTARQGICYSDPSLC